MAVNWVLRLIWHIRIRTNDDKFLTIFLAMLRESLYRLRKNDRYLLQSYCHISWQATQRKWTFREWRLWHTLFDLMNFVLVGFVEVCIGWIWAWREFELGKLLLRDELRRYISGLSSKIGWEWASSMVKPSVRLSHLCLCWTNVCGEKRVPKGAA